MPLRKCPSRSENPFPSGNLNVSPGPRRSPAFATYRAAAFGCSQIHAVHLEIYPQHLSAESETRRGGRAGTDVIFLDSSSPFSFASLSAPVRARRNIDRYFREPPESRSGSQIGLFGAQSVRCEVATRVLPRASSPGFLIPSW